MKWMGWAIALLCLFGFVALEEWGATRFRAAEADLEASLAEARQEAEARIGQARKTREEQQAVLAKLQEKCAEAQALREEHSHQADNLKETVAHLTAETERLRLPVGESVAVSSEEHDELREIEERISQAERDSATWERMIRMVSEPGKAL